MFFTRFVADFQLRKLAEKLRCPYQPYICTHRRIRRGNRRMLSNVEYCWMISLYNYFWSRWFHYMPDFLEYPHKSCNLELGGSVIPLGRCQKQRKKDDWLDWWSRRPTSLKKAFIGLCVKNHLSKTKLLGAIKVNPENFFQVMVNQGRRFWKCILYTAERS